MAHVGHYPIDTRAGKIERLHVQGEAIRPEAERMLDLVGVAEGSDCADLGCGPGGIAGWPNPAASR